MVRTSLRQAVTVGDRPVGTGPMQLVPACRRIEDTAGVEAAWRGAEIVSGITHLERATMHSLRRSARVRRGAVNDATLALNERTRRRGGVRQMSLAPGFSDGYLEQVHTPVALIPPPPLSLTVVDERLLLWGDGSPDGGLLVISDKRAVSLARRYLDELSEIAVPLQPRWRRAGINPTRRQSRIMSMLGQGATDEAMSRQLGITSRTVRSEVSHLAGLFGVQSRPQLLLAWTQWLQGR